MKNIITKAIWCLPAGALLSIIIHLLSHFWQGITFTTFIPETVAANTFSFGNVYPNLVYTLLDKSRHILYFAGELSLVVYVIEQTKMKQATYALVLLFIGHCVLFWGVTFMPYWFTEDIGERIFSDVQNNWQSRMLLYSFSVSQVIDGFVNFFTVVPGTLLLWYCLLKTNLYTRNTVGLYIIAMLVLVLHRFIDDRVAAEICFITGSALMAVACYNIARNTNFDGEIPVVQSIT